MNEEGDIAAQVGSEFAVFDGQHESFRRSVGALLLSWRVHFFNSFGAVVQHHFAIPSRDPKLNDFISHFLTFLPKS